MSDLELEEEQQLAIAKGMIVILDRMKEQDMNECDWKGASEDIKTRRARIYTERIADLKEWFNLKDWYCRS